MYLIKKIIREELEKVLANLGENGVDKSIDYDSTSTDDKDNIIYDYEKGRAFAGDNLEVDILNLNRYNLVEYLPKNSNEEMWSFEFYTVYGTTLIVDIKRVVSNNKSIWSLKFGQLYKGEQVPTLIAEINNINGYNNFIDVVNKGIGLKIDPSKY